MANQSATTPRAGITRTRLKLLLGYAVFRGALDLGYVTFVHANFAYAGFELDIHASRYVASWMLTLLAAAMTPARFTQAAHLFLAYLSVVMLAPLTSVYGLTSAPVLPLAVSLASYAIVRGVTAALPTFAVPRVTRGRVIALALAGAGLTFVIVRMALLGGLGNFNLDLRAVYEFREDQAEIVGGGLFNYVNVWASKVMAPFVLAIGLLYRRWSLVAAALVAHVVLFGVTAHKGVIVYPLVLIGVWLLFRRRPALWLLPVALTAVVLASLLVTSVSGDLLAASLLVRRVFFVPASLTLDYFEFFSQYPIVRWSNSVLEPFFTYPYTVSMSRTIGVWNGSGANANNGFVASGFAHANYLGVLAYSVILGSLLSVVNSVARNFRSQWFAASATFVPLMATVSSDLFTAMLTHGILLSVVLLLLAAMGGTATNAIRRF